MNNAAIVDIIQHQLAVGIRPTADQTKTLLAMIETLQAELRATINQEAEVARQASQERFRALFDATPLGLALIDPTGQIDETNAAFQQIVGYSQNELRGKSLSELIHPDTRSTYVSQIEELLDGRRDQYKVELRYLLKTAGELWVSQTGSLLGEAASSLVLTVIEEIPKRRQQHEALHEPEARYRTLANLISDYAYVCRVDAEGHVILEWVTDAFTRVTGYTIAEIASLGWQRLTHPHDRQIARQHLEALREGKRDEAEFRIVTKTGETRWISNRALPERDDRQDRIVRIVGAASDITERKRAEDRLHFLAQTSTLLKASLDYDQTLDQVAHLAVTFLGDGCFIDLFPDDHSPRRMIIAHVNPEKEQLLCELNQHYPIGEHWSQPIKDVMASHQPALIERISESLLQSAAQDDAQPNLLKQFTFQSAMIVPLLAHGRMFGTIVFVSERQHHRYTATDLALAEELGLLAAMAFDNARLYAQAQAAVEARDEFLSIAAHELKNPTAALLSATHLLRTWLAREPGSSERVKRELEVISIASGRLNKLIDSLTEFAQIQIGRFTLEHQPVALCSLARQVLSEVQSTPRHYVAIFCTDESLTIHGDARRLERALYNLVQNAVKYSPRGGPITLRVEQSGDYALIRVTDQGIGIPQAARSQLFQRFYRATNAIQQHIGGMGIGLYLVKEIVTRHGGEVEVSSMEGYGSTFTIRLPLRQEPGAR